MGECRGNSQRHQQRGQNRENVGPPERSEQAALNTAHCQHGQENEYDDESCVDYCTPSVEPPCPPCLRGETGRVATAGSLSESQPRSARDGVELLPRPVRGAGVHVGLQGEVPIACSLERKRYCIL